MGDTHTEREREREREAETQREKQTPRREPDAGLNPGTPGSRPDPKADAQPLSHVGALKERETFKRLLATPKCVGSTSRLEIYLRVTVAVLSSNSTGQQDGNSGSILWDSPEEDSFFFRKQSFALTAFTRLDEAHRHYKD